MGTKEEVSKTAVSIFKDLCLPLFCFDNFQCEQKTGFTLESSIIPVENETRGNV